MNRDGSPIREDYGLTACAFCTRAEPLRLSHIIPKFVYDWLKRTSATGTMRVGYEINRPVQDGFKTRLLCQDCEQRFNQWETPTAQEVFTPLADRQTRSAPYGPWLAKFAASVSWRVLTVLRLGGALDDWPPPLRTTAQTALCYWSKFLKGERPHPGPFEQHLVPFDLIEAAMFHNLPPKADRYLLRAVEMDFARSDRSTFVYAKLGPLVLFGVINQVENVWKGTKLHMKGGIVGSEQYVIPTELGEFMWTRAQRMQELEGEMSPRRTTLRTFVSTSPFLALNLYVRGDVVTVHPLPPGANTWVPPSVKSKRTESPWIEGSAALPGVGSTSVASRTSTS